MAAPPAQSSARFESGCDTQKGGRTPYFIIAARALAMAMLFSIGAGNFTV